MGCREWGGNRVWRAGRGQVVVVLGSVQICIIERIKGQGLKVKIEGSHTTAAERLVGMSPLRTSICRAPDLETDSRGSER